MRLTVKASPINGSGVFAEDPIRQGELIHRMGGRRVSLIRCIAEIVTRSIRIDDPLPIQKYKYLILDEFSILFNHCCQANAGVANEVDLVALTNISPGEEITFDYSMTVRPSLYTTFWKMHCNCGAPLCRKKIGDVRSVPLQHLQRYLNAGALQDFILASLKVRETRVPDATPSRT